MIKNKTPENLSAEAAGNLLSLAILRIESDGEIIEKLQKAHAKSISARSRLRKRNPGSGRTGEGKESLLTALSRGLAKALSLKRRGLRRCLVLAVVSLSILTGGLTGVARYEGSFARGDQAHEVAKTQVSRRNNITEPLMALLSSGSDTQGRPRSLLYLRFPVGERIELSAPLGKEKELFERGVNEVILRYEEALPGIGSSVLVRKVLLESLERLGGKRLLPGASLPHSPSGYISINMIDILSRAIRSVPEQLARGEEKNTAPGGAKERGVKQVVAEHMEKLLVRAGSPAGSETEKKAKGYADAIYSAHRSYGICPFLITAIIDRESGGREGAVSPTKQGYGLMQVNWSVHKKWVPDWFPDIQTLEDIMEPANNILVGAAIYRGVRKRARDDEKALSLYLGADNPAYARSVLSVANDLEKTFKTRSQATKNPRVRTGVESGIS